MSKKLSSQLRHNPCRRQEKRYFNDSMNKNDGYKNGGGVKHTLTLADYSLVSLRQGHCKASLAVLLVLSPQPQVTSRKCH